MKEKISVQNDTKSIAVYSDCEQYRYTLTRIWNENGKRVLFIGLNPSTATELVNDPTVTRMIGFAKKWDMGSITVCNLFSFRATIPNEMKQVEDPIGEHNDMLLKKELEKADLIIAAWGNHGTYRDRSKDIKKHLNNFSHLGLTKIGEPKHVLYLPGNSTLQEATQ